MSKRVLFATKDTFRGAAVGTVEIATGAGGGDCGYNFEVGRSYLVYASRNPEGSLATGICSRTRPIEEASEDLTYIRSLSKAAPVAFVSGMIEQMLARKSTEEWRPPLPMSGVSALLSNDRAKFEARSDKDGKFRFEDVPPGEYRLKINAPDGFWPPQTEESLTLLANGCVESHTTLTRDTSISGNVTTHDGIPGAKIMVYLVPIDQIGAQYQRDTAFAQTDETGAFTIRSAPGSYYLGVRLSQNADPTTPFPRTFYPGVTDIADAATILIEEGKVLQGFDFQLGQRMRMRKVEGQIVMPDGKPAALSNVCSEEIEYSKGSACHGPQTPVDAEGRFTMLRPEGIAIRLRAYASLPDGKQIHAELVNVPADGNRSGIRLVLTKPNGSCEKCRQ